ncbi:hypothetical protein ERJ75_000681100 [Trypanosoma vivax]|uniref:Ubiquitin-like domain-containing protein n=1 Tax=Trypanosoma vivax (strain Y486) TaxID=1055687 RepID=G0U5M4_TRYVY|nr:hypothetical protein TRVL_04997 [Trypanosoma vivax]KAH8614498.1 hypothetical protein ERJ75_000681100 [Trypanosoma vivax]CCC51175.1 conserved hypothetical protein [Trypanosoma vivax Y486]
MASPLASPGTQSTEIEEIHVMVTHAARRLRIVLPAVSAKIKHLKAELEKRCGVPVNRQRLLFCAPVLKPHRRGAADDMRLVDIIAPQISSAGSACKTDVPGDQQYSDASGPAIAHGGTNDVLEVAAIKANNGPGASSTSNASHEMADPSSSSLTACTSSKVVSIPLMLIGTAAAAPQVNEEAVAQLHRLVTNKVQRRNQWFLCSYNKGYVRQTAFVCRTCINNGSALPYHAVCYACAEICHDNHVVEEWGLRYFMRCDCCTMACWRDADGHSTEETNVKEENGAADAVKEKSCGNSHDSSNTAIVPAESSSEQRRCCFVIDKDSGLPPTSTALVPLNSKNRYPRSARTWCYCDCADDQPPDGADALGGIVCLLCSTCYWSSHVTRLKADILHTLPCYGDGVVSDVVAFCCHTCDTLVCGPCRLRCHSSHNVENIMSIPLEEHEHEQQDESQPMEQDESASLEAFFFSCGCGCSIESTSNGSGTEAAQNFCSRNTDLPPVPSQIVTEMMNYDSYIGFLCAHCMQEHPWLVENDLRKCYSGKLPDPVPAVKHKPPPPCGFGVTEPIPSDVFPYHGMLLPVTAFTEEMTCTCGPCRQAYETFAPRACETAGTMAVQLHDDCDHCGQTECRSQIFICQDCGLMEDKAFFICQRCNTLRLAAQMPGMCGASAHTDAGACASTTAPTNPDPVTAPDGSKPLRPWDHPLSHTFIEGTRENVCGLISMYLSHNQSGSVLQRALGETETGRVLLDELLPQNFVNVPINFDPKDVAQHQQLLSQRYNARLVGDGKKAPDKAPKLPSTTAGVKHARGDGDTVVDGDAGGGNTFKGDQCD